MHQDINKTTKATEERLVNEIIPNGEKKERRCKAKKHGNIREDCEESCGKGYIVPWLGTCFVILNQQYKGYLVFFGVKLGLNPVKRGYALKQGGYAPKPILAKRVLSQVKKLSFRDVAASRSCRNQVVKKLQDSNQLSCGGVSSISCRFRNRRIIKKLMDPKLNTKANHGTGDYDRRNEGGVRRNTAGLATNHNDGKSDDSFVNENQRRGEEEDRGRGGELPVFEGIDPLNWINHAEIFFELQGVAEEEEVRLAYISMEGSEKAKNRSWDGLKQALVIRFGTYIELLAASKQKDPKKIGAIHQWPTPKTAECQGLAKSQATMTTTLVLTLPVSHNFFIECDTSGNGIDSSLTKSIDEKELMALVLVIQHWRPYLLQLRFTVYTNQRSLRYILEQQDNGFQQSGKCPIIETRGSNRKEKEFRILSKPFRQDFQTITKEMDEDLVLCGSMEGRVSALERLTSEQGRAIAKLRESFQEVKEMIREYQVQERESKGSEKFVMKGKKEGKTGMDAEKYSLQNIKKGKKFYEEREYLANDEEKKEKRYPQSSKLDEKEKELLRPGVKTVGSGRDPVEAPMSMAMATKEFPIKESKDGKKETSIMEAVQTVSEHTTTLVLYGDDQVILEDLEVEMRKRKLSQRFATTFLSRARAHWSSRSFGLKQLLSLMEQKELKILSYQPPPNPSDLKLHTIASGFPSDDNTISHCHGIMLQYSNLEDKVVLQRRVMIGI
ncbi:hypothetical protein V8G54_018357 [Vigna mungo]|uniref:Reverse transcriptase RNase H-like domain-containing protein n=1 Tax=Vigna mungo TaxID=3915 RepID=A0AAQ3RUN4_VIGMU